MKNKRFTITGHRGTGSGPEENTIASFKAAIAAGADRIETDVQLIDGELMLAHPPRQPKTSLKEMLFEIDHPVILHVKRRHFSAHHDRRVMRRLVRLIKDRENVTVSSFWAGTHLYLRRKSPKTRRALLSLRPHYDRYYLSQLKVAEYHPYWMRCTDRVIEHAHAQGVSIHPWTPNKIADISALHSRGVDGVITDRVDHALAGADYPLLPGRSIVRTQPHR